MTPRELEASLTQFTGTENWYPHLSGLLFTDGVKHLCDNAGAYWLLDLIGSYQKRCRKDRMLRDFQIWELRVTGHQADAVCLRDTNDEAFRQHIHFTDFPLNLIKLYVEGDVVMLPRER